MARAELGRTAIEYDTFGDPSAPAMLLIMGLGAQMIAWRPEFCSSLADRGFFVIRYDNRDSGLSTALDAFPPPDPRDVLAGDTSAVPYLIADMAQDAADLLSVLGVGSAHVVGASMGGMIAQQLTIDHPSRVRSLCSIMSTTGHRSVGRATSEAIAALSQPPATSREEAVARGLRTQAVIGSPAYPVPEAVVRARLGEAYERADRPAGYARQYAAIIASPDRTSALGAVAGPTLVIHGADDPLIDRSGGEATAAAVPDAELLVLPGMGHDLPEELWPRIVEAIARNAGRA